jgi:dipeptidase
MCDTFIALPGVTEDGSILFAKNSDREPNEAQALEYHPAGAFPSGDTLSCTYMVIPQERETHAILISRPFWMWGAEMGANEKGVVIGNEAVFTRMPYDKKGGLTGMDLLRLALERSDTASAALETIVQLLSDYGQGGACGYTNKRLRYHNSFIVADSEEAWVLETAGPFWAALRIKDAYAISNGLTIGEHYDEGHPGLIDFARKKGWLKKRVTFHFANCFSDWFFTTFSAGHKRRKRVLTLLQAKRKVSLGDVIHILRDHGGPDYRPDSHWLLDHVCAHGANRITRDAAQSTGSLIARLQPLVNTFWATGTSAPCSGVFKPVWFGDRVLPDTGPIPGATYNPDCLWWFHERLHRSVLLDYETRLAVFRQERDALEDRFMKAADRAQPGDRWSLSQNAFSEAHRMEMAWTHNVETCPVRKRTKRSYRRYWKKHNAAVGLYLA